MQSCLFHRHDRVVGAHDVVHGGAAGADDHRLADLRHVLEQRRVDDVAGRELERRHVELGEEVGAVVVERSGEERDPDLLAEADQFHVFVAPELQRLAVRPVGVAEGVLALIGAVVHLAGEQRAIVALLQLDRVGAAFLGGAKQVLALRRGRPGDCGRSRRSRSSRCRRRRADRRSQALAPLASPRLAPKSAATTRAVRFQAVYTVSNIDATLPGDRCSIGAIWWRFFVLSRKNEECWELETRHAPRMPTTQEIVAQLGCHVRAN